jgi:LIVCS family branched-chain amino acid:cation transporter
MGLRKDDFIVGFALFALFFGVGNIVLPPMLGFLAGQEWYLVALGFVVTAIGIPLLGIFAHARLQGTMIDFGKPVSKIFSLIFCILIYVISAAIPSPRTAAFTYEMAFEPFFNISPLAVSILYFSLIFVFVAKRSTVLNNIGKYITPAILILILGMIFFGIFEDVEAIKATTLSTPILDGFFEGYQTFDAIGALVVGGVIIISVKLKGYTNQAEAKKLITKAAIISALGLLIIYCGLIYEGALFSHLFSEDVTRTQLLSGLSSLTLGPYASICLAILVSLACFTTAVGIVTGTADFFSEQFKYKYSYITSVTIACLFGIVVGAFSVDFIITLALPVLLLVYPLTIVLIILNVLSNRFRHPFIMKLIVLFTSLFSIPDALKVIFPDSQAISTISNSIPLSNFGLGWLIPAALALLIGWLITLNKSIT